MFVKDNITGKLVKVHSRFVDKPKLLYRKFAYNDIQPILDEENWKLVKADEVDAYVDYINKKIKDYDIDADYIMLDECKLYDVKSGEVVDGCKLFKYNALVLCRQLDVEVFYN